MLPDSPSPRAALALSDLQPQTGATANFSIASSSGNWSTRGVGGVSGDYIDKTGGGMFGNSRNNDRFAFGNNNSSSSSNNCFSSTSNSSGGLFSSK
ncbi:unnamed protein product [Caenorhabditis nigoni]|uniref:Uncharacterized protein n=2 Tax=Caenorhabditis TaxID=6237 RepID=A0AAE9DQV0_CAEBR|nr:hypothetical protein L3Y34_014093 [Caenorhabditis briggsae]